MRARQKMSVLKHPSGSPQYKSVLLRQMRHGLLFGLIANRLVAENALVLEYCLGPLGHNLGLQRRLGFGSLLQL